MTVDLRWVYRPKPWDPDREPSAEGTELTLLPPTLHQAAKKQASCTVLKTPRLLCFLRSHYQVVVDSGLKLSVLTQGGFWSLFQSLVFIPVP